MSSTDVHQEIRRYLVEEFLFGRKEDLTDDAPLLDTVIDSHGVVEFVLFLQERFGFQVEDDEVNTNNLGSVNKTAAYVQGKLTAEPRTIANEA